MFIDFVYLFVFLYQMVCLYVCMHLVWFGFDQETLTPSAKFYADVLRLCTMVFL